jgi:hypothetical protein
MDPPNGTSNGSNTRPWRVWYAFSSALPMPL